MAANKIAEACAAFDESLKLDPAITTLIALATCRERLGELATAMELFLEAAQQTHSTSNSQAAQLQKIARERAASLDPRVSRLTISVPEQSKVDQLEILRGRDVVAVERWNRALPVDGGMYTITARAPGRKDWSIQVTLAVEADAKTIEIPVLRPRERDVPEGSRQPSGAKPPRPAALPPETPNTTKQRQGLLPIAVGSTAVALLGSALGVSLWGDSTYGKAKAEMTNQARRDALEASANRKHYVAQGLAVAGIGCAGVAVWLYVRRRGRDDVTASSRTAKLMLVPTLSSIDVFGQF